MIGNLMLTGAILSAAVAGFLAGRLWEKTRIRRLASYYAAQEDLLEKNTIVDDHTFPSEHEHS